MYTPINLCISACVYKLCVCFFYVCMHLLMCAKACIDVYTVRHKDFSVLPWVKRVQSYRVRGWLGLQKAPKNRGLWESSWVRVL